MLNRLYADNFRALVNCELRLEPRNLLMGRNATGKTTLTDVLVSLQLLLFGRAKIDDFFGPETLTRWQQSARQRFELDVSSPHGTYQYGLTIEHSKQDSPDQPGAKIASETLTLDGKPMLRFSDGIVQLFLDDHSPGPEYPFDPGRSALGTITPRRDNPKFVWFGKWVLNTTVISSNPPQMDEFVERDDRPMLLKDAKNFAAWYRVVSAGDKRQDQMLHETLAEILPGFEALNFEFAGPSRWLLRAEFNDGGRRLNLRFDELSDGQRQIVLLYAVSHFLLGQGKTVILDEPDNFVSLDEIQPWLLGATDLVDGGSGQLVIISHHPEIFNQWAVDHGIVTERDGCGPVRIRKFFQRPGTGLTPAEEISRGWNPAGASTSAVESGGRANE